MSIPSHPMCRTSRGHVCQVPSGRSCIEDQCNEPAGTLWGPFWCPEHDAERIDRISRGLDDIARPVQPLDDEAYRALQELPMPGADK